MTSPSDNPPTAAAGADSLSLVSPDGRVIRVRDGDVVGRTAVGREVLDIHEEISRRHAQFVRAEGEWYIIDLNSSNGTFLEGAKLPPRERVLLMNGQALMLSPVFQATVAIPEEAGERPAAGEPEGNRRTMVILFADLKGSVDFFQEKGTIVAHNWIVQLYRMLTSIVARRNGTHVKNIGDAILAVFDDPCEAAKAAVEMQEDLRRHNSSAEETGRYYLRIGLNIGSLLFESNDVFGNAVNIAARVQALAPPEHIYITQALRDAVRDIEDMRFRFIGDEQLKGVRGKTGIYEILCGGENA